MALKVAVASGNWSNPATWNGGTLPRVDDIVASNTYTVTIDQNVTVVQLTNKTATATRSNPAMTSPTAPSGIVTSFPSDSGTGDAAWRAFDNSESLSPSWYAGGAYPKWIAYEYPSPIVITKYYLALRGDNYSPKDWTFEGWNGSSWVVLDTVSNYVSGGSYVSPILANTTAYSKYRFNVTADRGAGLLIILEISLYEIGYTQNAFQGGGFIIGPNVSVVTTSSGVGFDAFNTANGLVYSANSPSVSSFVGNLQGLTTNNLLTVTGTGTLNIVGNITTSQDNRAQGTIQVENNATINITGNLSYGGGNRALNVSSVTTSAIINITGDVFISYFTWGGHRTISFDGGGTLNITGLIYHGLTNNSSDVNVIVLNAPQTKTITFNHIGIITRTNPTYYGGYACVYMGGLGNIFINLDQLVGGFGPLFGGQTTTSYIFLKKLKSGSYGQDPLNGLRRAFLVPQTSNTIEYRDNSTNGAQSPSGSAPTFTLYAPSATVDLPSTSDVRFGTVYGFSSLVGTARVPHPNQVTYGVAVDNTFGTAVLTAASVWDYLVSNINTADSIGMRLKNVSTPQTTGEQLEAFLRLD